MNLSFIMDVNVTISENKKASIRARFLGNGFDYLRTAMASISMPTSFGRRATSTQERAG